MELYSIYVVITRTTENGAIRLYARTNIYQRNASEQQSFGVDTFCKRVSHEY